MPGDVDELLSFIRSRWPRCADAGLVLGSGAGGVADAIEAEAVFGYAELPHFPRSTAVGHQGRLICGRLAGRRVIAMQGRAHLYEGRSLDEVTIGVRLMAAAGARAALLTNAAGGMRPSHSTGDIVIIDDHICFMGEQIGALARTTPARIGACYDADLIERALVAARREGFAAHRGVYVAVTGPNYETRAEYRLFRQLGGDVVGMSTVPEALAARAAGLRVLALSIVTNVALPDAPQETDHAAVLAAAGRSQSRVLRIIEAALSQIDGVNGSGDCNEPPKFQLTCTD